VTYVQLPLSLYQSFELGIGSKLSQWCRKVFFISGHVWAFELACVTNGRFMCDFCWFLWLQSAMSVEAGMQPGHHSSSSSGHSFGKIASGHPHGSLRHSHQKHRSVVSPSTSKKHPSACPHVGGALHCVHSFFVVILLTLKLSVYMQQC